MAGSTESNARMEALTTNLSSPCPEGTVRNKATGGCDPVKKEIVEAEVITTDNPNDLPEGELSAYEKKHGKLNPKEEKISDALSELRVKQLQEKFKNRIIDKKLNMYFIIKLIVVKNTNK